MAQFSGWWTTNAAGSGDQVEEYTQAHLALFAAILASCSGFEGVSPNWLNKLACSDGGVNTVDVASGGAVVDGIIYENDSKESVNIPSASGGGNTRIDRIVLRADWSAFTVRITRIAGTDAASPTAPAITQTPGTTYDIKLCQVLVDTGGNVTVTDERQWAVHPVDDSTIESNLGQLRVKDAGITTDKLANSAITAAKIANRTRSIFVPAVSSIADGEFTQIDRVTPLGYLTSSSFDQSIFGNLVVPKDYVPGTDITVKLLYYVDDASGVPGNIRITTEIDFGANGEIYNQHSAGGSYSVVAISATDRYREHSVVVSGAAQGDILKLRGRRTGSHVSDTYTGGAVYFVGWSVEYTADS